MGSHVKLFRKVELPFTLLPHNFPPITEKPFSHLTTHKTHPSQKGTSCTWTLQAFMALLVPGGCARVGFSRPAHVRRRLTTFATVSPTRGDRVDWVEATSGFFENDTRPIMLFDGVCNLCNGGVKFVRDNDRNRRIRFEALQSEAGKKLLRRSGRAPDDISSVVLVEQDRSFIKSEAVVKIMEYIDLPFPQLAFFLQFVPLFVRDFLYDNVANNRYTIFGRSDACEI